MDEANSLAIGMVGVNNVHLSESEVDADYRVCSPVEGHAILQDINDIDNIEYGVVYACEYEDMLDLFEEVPDLGDMGILL